VDLGGLLKNLTLKTHSDPNVLVGFDTSDDAGVYRLREDLALVQTVDFITPVCDDAYTFGQVAAANSLSDVYAMGGRPLTVMNICCFPPKGVPLEVYQKILEGGLSKTVEAGAALMGGHTVKDEEMKYGLSVTGLVDPKNVLRNSGARPGDALVLTKPVGTGVLITGSKRGIAPPDAFQRALAYMARLNDVAGEMAVRFGANACTDITGFGLAGHALEIAKGSRVGLRVRFSDLPHYPESLELIEQGVKTGVTDSNRTLAGESIRFAGGLTETQKTLFFDPQTSGGLLISAPAGNVEALVGALVEKGQADSRIIGEVMDAPAPFLEVVPG
jgi:selenide,water dikinase